MTELMKKEVSLEDNSKAIITYFLIESNTGVRRPYGIRAELHIMNEKIDEAEAAARFATTEEAAAVAKILAEDIVTPITLNEVI